MFHARFTDHVYPPHTHADWTLLIVDEGAVRYELDHHEHGALRSSVTLLPPGIPHDGRAAAPGGFRKVLYLTDAVLGADLVGPAVDRPALADTVLRRRVHELHGALARPGDELEARSRLALVGDRLTAHLRRADPRSPVHRDRGRRDGCATCWTHGPPRAWAWTRPPRSCTRTRRTWCGRSPGSSGVRHTGI